MLLDYLIAIENNFRREAKIKKKDLVFEIFKTRSFARGAQKQAKTRILRHCQREGFRYYGGDRAMLRGFSSAAK